MYKKSILAAFVLTLAVLLAACSSQPTPQPATEPAETQIQTLPGISNPYPSADPQTNPQANPTAGDAYPAADPTQSNGDGAYPDITDGSEITWEQALTLLRSGQVAQVSQSHDLTVSLRLKDGRTLQTVEPAIDAILQEIQACGDPCKAILIATE